MISRNYKVKDIKREWTQKAIEELATSIRGGDRNALSIGITLIESKDREDQAWSDELLALTEDNGRSSRSISITGPPGAGKSSFIEAIGQRALDENKTVAVLSIDPSSEMTGGSILGDKTRMQVLAADERAFIRPSPSGGELGGVNDRTWEVRQLCESAGYDYIFVETVGVGQAESEVRHLTDMVVVLAQPGAGDDIQGIKKGLNEIADFFVITKADGDQSNLARETKSFILNSIGLGERNFDSGNIQISSIYDKELIAKCWESVKNRYEELVVSEEIASRRKDQSTHWFTKKSRYAMLSWIFSDDEILSLESECLKKIESDQLRFNEALKKFLNEAKKKYSIDENGADA